jgi:hypothetical protein
MTDEKKRFSFGRFMLLLITGLSIVIPFVFPFLAGLILFLKIRDFAEKRWDKLTTTGGAALFLIIVYPICWCIALAGLLLLVGAESWASFFY